MCTKQNKTLPKLFLLSQKNRDHPLLKSLADLLSTETETSSLFENRCVRYVATYLITDEGNLYVKRGRRGITTFGGCNFPNALPRMINSLRLELMDESSILLTEINTIRISSPHILPVSATDCVLLQVAYVRESCLYDMWSPEKARSKLRGKVAPDIIFSGKATEEIKLAGRIIECQNLLRGEVTGKNWRKCDWDSFRALEEHGVFRKLFENEPIEDTIVVLRNDSFRSNSSTKNAGILANMVNQPIFSSLRQVFVQPWAPLLWAEADHIFVSMQRPEIRKQIVLSNLQMRLAACLSVEETRLITVAIDKLGGNGGHSCTAAVVGVSTGVSLEEVESDTSEISLLQLTWQNFNLEN